MTGHVKLSMGVDEVVVMDTGRTTLRVALDGGHAIDVRRTRGLAARAGDRVLLLHTPGGPVAFAVLACEGDSELEVRAAGGSCELLFADGDLTLRAPGGRVRISSGTDVHIEAGREVSLESQAGGRAGKLALDGQGARLAGATIRAQARVVAVEARDASLEAHTLSTAAHRMAANVERYELTAGRIVETARETLREASELAEHRAERLKMRVRDAWNVLAGRTTLVSDEDTAIDGRKVLLG